MYINERLNLYKRKVKIGGRKMLNKALKRNKGITLIALVVTIIVLLILARCKYINANRAKWNIK